MRIVHLTRDFPPRLHGGISSAVGSLTAALRAAGVASAVISFDDWRPRRRAHGASAPAARDEHGITVLRVTAPGDLDAARAFAHEQRPDILHVHHPMLWEIAAELRARLRVPAVLTVHVLQRAMNAVRGSDERTLSLIAEETALADADLIIAPSHAVAALLGDAARVRVAPPGCERPPAAGRDRDPGAFLSVGRFDDVKGTPELFEAIPRILTALPEAHFTIAGGVPANRRAERRWLAQWEGAAPAEIRARVRIAGWLGATDVEACYAQAGIVVIPSRFETFGMVALEAMRHRIPIAATAAGGLAEIVRDGETGLLSPVGDVAALVANALRLAPDAALRERLARAATARVEREWLWPQRVPAMLAVYRELAR